MKNDNIPVRNKSPFGWWIAVLVERFCFYSEENKESMSIDGCDECFHLIKATDREEAYKKAIALGEAGDNIEGIDVSTGQKGVWKFLGLASLMPVYERIEDGAEVYCRELNDSNIETVADVVRKKEELECFDDGDV